MLSYLSYCILRSKRILGFKEFVSPDVSGDILWYNIKGMKDGWRLPGVLPKLNRTYLRALESEEKSDKI